MTWARKLLPLEESEQLVHLDCHFERFSTDLLTLGAILPPLLVAALAFLPAIFACAFLLIMPAQARLSALLTKSDLLVVTAESKAFAYPTMLFLMGVNTQASSSCPFLLAVSANIPKLFVLTDILTTAVDAS